MLILSKSPKVLHSETGSHPIFVAVWRFACRVESHFFAACNAEREWSEW